MKSITVLLAEDHELVREGIRSLLDKESDIEVVGEAGTGRQAVTLAKTLRPDVVVMDIAMPKLNGLEATRQIRHDLPETKVVILSGHDDLAYVEQTASSGATGYLLKHSSSQALNTAIREVKNGNRFASPSITKRIQARDQSASDQGYDLKKKGGQLSPREMEVLQLIAEGMSNKQIAEELNLCFKTIDKHRQHLMSKLNIHDSTGLTRYAISEGIIENAVIER